MTNYYDEYYSKVDVEEMLQKMYKVTYKNEDYLIIDWDDNFENFEFDRFYERAFKKTAGSKNNKRITWKYFEEYQISNPNYSPAFMDE